MAQVMVAPKIGILQPKREVRNPDSGEENRDPAPTHSNKRPKPCSSRAKRSLMKGIIGAHAAIAKPAAKKPIRLERIQRGKRLRLRSFPVLWIGLSCGDLTLVAGLAEFTGRLELSEIEFACDNEVSLFGRCCDIKSAPRSYPFKTWPHHDSVQKGC